MHITLDGSSPTIEKLVAIAQIKTSEAPTANFGCVVHGLGPLTIWLVLQLGFPNITYRNLSPSHCPIQQIQQRHAQF
jgi:hypothetical protein